MWHTGKPNDDILSYLHIAIQPFFINAFAMELVPESVKNPARLWVFGACAVSTVTMLAQIVSWPSLGACLPGSALCGDRWCTVSGDWHIAWGVPYNGLLLRLERAFGVYTGFPTYMIAAFIVPLIYGAWRFVIVHAAAGPILAASLTSNPNEMPAIWCLFSINILLIGLNAPVRKTVTATRWWGRQILRRGCCMKRKLKLPSHQHIMGKPIGNQPLKPTQKPMGTSSGARLVGGEPVPHSGAKGINGGG